MPRAHEREPTFRISPTFLSRHELTRMGLTRHLLDRALAQGRIIRVRKGRYVHGDLDSDLLTVARLGARLDCVSLLRRLGVFVCESAPPMHIQVDVGASRLPTRPPRVVCHWRESRAPAGTLVSDLVEALAQAVRCQGPREAIATLDSALHNRLIDERELNLVFARLPQRFAALKGLLDARSESGSESLMRLILRTLGCEVDIQVRIHGVGRVDFVVDGWLIIECDSEAHHSGWDAQKRDRRRDLAAARLGYSTVRVIAEDVFFHRDEVREALAEVLAHGPGRRRGTNSSGSGRTR
jgi:very-short-patch-repair endonuclease